MSHKKTKAYRDRWGHRDTVSRLKKWQKRGKRLGGAATVRVQWKRHRQELLDACPMGWRCWGFWQIEMGLLHQPAGEAGELRLIKQLDLYRDEAEREFVQKRLAVITAELRSHWHSRVA